MTHPKSAVEILDESAKNELYDNWDEQQSHLINYCIKNGKEGRARMDNIIFQAMHTFAEVWLREFAGRIITGTDSAQATYVATSLRDQIIKEMKGETP